MLTLWFIHLLRFCAFFISLIAFSCHLAQCLLFDTYQEKTGVAGWLTAGHWQYLTWYISLGFSLVSGIAVNVSACLFRRSAFFSIDKCVGFVALLPVLCSIVAALLFDSVEPFTNGFVKFDRPPSGLLTYCILLDEAHDKYYPIYLCILSDMTWISALAVCGIWILLVGCIIGMSLGKEKPSIYVEMAEEPQWGRYIPDRTIISYPKHHQSVNHVDDHKSKKEDGAYFFMENNNIPPIYKSSTTLFGNLEQDLQQEYPNTQHTSLYHHRYEDAYPIESSIQYVPSFALQRERISYHANDHKNIK